MRSRGDLPATDVDVYVADTLGELGLIYRLAPIVFMGGSLARHGGQNPIEAVKLGAAMLHGPHVWNFSEIYATLDQAGGAEQVADAEALIARLGAWLADPALRQGGRQGRGNDGGETQRRTRAYARRARSLSDAASARAAGG